jgi:hypothetical protein
MKIPLVGAVVDERFLNHRLKSTSLAGIITGVTASLLFAYRFYVNHVWSWDLLSVALTFVGVKMAMMAWYLITD